MSVRISNTAIKEQTYYKIYIEQRTKSYNLVLPLIFSYSALGGCLPFKAVFRIFRLKQRDFRQPFIYKVRNFKKKFLLLTGNLQEYALL